MTEKRFTYVKNNSISQYSILPIQEIGKKTYHCQGIVDELNRLSNENEELKEEIVLWKECFGSHSNMLNILLHELDIAKSQGYKPSDAYNKLVKNTSDLNDR